MKKVLSLVLAIVMMASLLVVSTSAAAVPSTVIIGTSTEKLGNAYANATLPFVTDANAAGMDSLTFYSQELEKSFAVGTAGVPVSFYLYLGNNTTDALAAYGASRLFEGYNQTTDYTTVEVTKGYSLVSCTATLDTASVVYKVGEANVADKGLMLVTLAPVAGNITGGEVVIKFTHNAFQADTKTYNKTSKYLKFNYAVPGAASIKATTPVNNGKDGLLYTVGNGTLINDEMIKTVKGNSLMWTNAAADANTFVPGAYSVAVLFQKVTNLTPVTLSVTVDNKYEGIDAPVGSLKVVKFAANHAVADAAMVSVVLDADFLNINGKDLNVYFIEDVEGASTTVKGAKATLVGKAVVGRDTLDLNTIASFSLLNNKLGTYIITGKTLSSDAAADTAPEATPEVPNVNTGADNTVNVAIVLAVLALAAAGFVAVKKVK